MTGAHAGRRYLVTGATGFIGHAVCARLAALGAEVYGSSRRTSGQASAGESLVRVDLSDAAGTDRRLEEIRPDFVIHLAGSVTGRREIEWVRETFRGNLQSAVNLLVAAERAGVSKVVLAGSLEEPDAREPLPVPTSPYAASKWSASGYARMMHALYGMRIATARIFMVYGPGQNDLQKLVPYVCLRAAAGESPRLMSGGRLVDWVYIDDVVDGLLSLAAGGPEDGSYVDLGSGRLVTTGKVAEMICEIAGTGVRPELGVVPDRPMEQVRRADAEATRKAVGWEARNGLAQGLERTYHWYRNLAAAGIAGPEDPGTL